MIAVAAYPGKEIHLEDLPLELKEEETQEQASGDWRQMLRSWGRKRLQEGAEGLLSEAGPEFETIMIEIALEHTAGRRQDAARLLGWGRNTLTRKIKELGLQSEA